MRLVGALLVLSVVYSTLVCAAHIELEVYDALEGSETVSVIVELEDIAQIEVLSKASAERREQQLALRKERIQRQRSRVMERLGLASLSVSEGNPDVVTREFATLNAFTGNITRRTLDRIAVERDVKAVYIERVLKVQLNDTRVQIDTQLVQGGGLSTDGSGETICVLDTGIDYNHTYLGAGWGNLVLDGYDYINNDNDPWDDNSHGTHVAGIIASQHSLIQGVAPGARLIAQKVCNSGGSCTSGAMNSGMDWCINNATKYNISVITISIGDEAEYNSSNCPTWLDSAIDTAVGMGILVTISSGNDFFKNGISYPACSPNATSVGAVAKAGNVPSYSNSGDLLDLLAPGGTLSVRINSTTPNSDFGMKYGTSMACPHVAAAAALLQQYNKEQGGGALTPSELSIALTTTGTNMTDAGNNITAPMMNVFGAVKSIDTPPLINVSDPTDNLITSASSYMIVAASDKNLSVALLEWNSTNITMDGSGRSWNHTVSGHGSFHYRVLGNDSFDVWGNSSVQSIYLNNTAPVITSYFPNQSTVNIAEPQNQSFNISYTEPDSQSVNVSWYLNSTQVGTGLSYDFPGNYTAAGSYHVWVLVNDSELYSNNSWSLVINNTNRLPSVLSATIQPQQPSINSDLVCDNGSVSDPDNDAVTLSYDWHNGSWLNISNRVLRAGNTTTNSEWRCSITPYDSHGNGSTVVSSTVQINNTPPNITSSYPSVSSFSIAEPANQSFNVTVVDSEQAYTISWQVNGTNQTAWYDNEVYTFISGYNTSGGYNITVLASDGSLASTTSWLLTVNNSNRAPQQNSLIPVQRIYMNSNTSLNLSTFFSDSDEEALTYSFTAVSDVTVTVNSGVALLKPDTNWTGSRILFFNVSDGIDRVNSSLNMTVTADWDSDGHNATAFGGDDCSDNNLGVYPGASCTLTCYSGSTYDASCSCTGVTYTCGGGGSGGGGGGGVATIPGPGTTRFYDVVEAGTTTEFSVSTDAVSVKGVSFTTRTDARDVTIKVKAASANITTENAYAYFEIDHENLEEGTIEVAEISFAVNKSWLAGYDSSSVRLNRHYNNAWRALATEQTDETIRELLFTARTPGFSVFAITAEPRQEAANESPKPIDYVESSMVPVSEEPAGVSGHVPMPADRMKTVYEIAVFALAGLTIILIIVTTYILVSLKVGLHRMHRLEEYILRRLSLGHKEHEIHTSLKELGWEHHVIHRHVTRAKDRHLVRELDSYIERALNKGHTERQIISALEKRGWPHKKIREHLKRARKRLKH